MPFKRISQAITLMFQYFDLIELYTALLPFSAHHDLLHCYFIFCSSVIYHNAANVIFAISHNLNSRQLLIMWWTVTKYSSAFGTRTDFWSNWIFEIPHGVWVQVTAMPLKTRLYCNINANLPCRLHLDGTSSLYIIMSDAAKEMSFILMNRRIFSWNAIF